MEMNIKFEWSEPYERIFGESSLCWLGPMWVGEVIDAGDGNVTACFGGDNRTREGLIRAPIATVDEAKAWVEEQARAWLADVTNA